MTAASNILEADQRLVVLRRNEQVETTWGAMEPDDIPLGLLDQAPSPSHRTLDNAWYRDARMTAILGGERYLTAKPNVYGEYEDLYEVLAWPMSSDDSGGVPMPCPRCRMAGVTGGVIATRPEFMACGWSRLPAAIYGMALCTGCYGRRVVTP